MRSTIFLKRSLFIISIAGTVFSFLLIFFLAFNLRTQSLYTKPASRTTALTPRNLVEAALVEKVSFSESARSGLPLRLKIPKINVDAAVESVGLTPQGAMGVPKRSINVAWFNLGPRPGQNGSAVMDGHYGPWRNGDTSVFDDLNQLEKGDKLYVRDEKGVLFTFVVRELRTFGPNERVQDVFSSNDGKAHLNLITCDGVWDKRTMLYTKRLVVFTDREVI